MLSLKEVKKEMRKEIISSSCIAFTYYTRRHLRWHVYHRTYTYIFIYIHIYIFIFICILYRYKRITRKKQR